MSATPPDPDRRKKLIGRLVVIALGLLIAVYLVPMFLSLMR
ncbi:hypothetical protein [Phenylobacterium sp.]|nr:hypothetical protein [Phenylobacterium sp.]